MSTPNEIKAQEEAEALRTFKRKAKGFIKWVCDDDEQTRGTYKADCRAVGKAKTFAEVGAILARHDYDGMFLRLTSEGYF